MATTKKTGTAGAEAAALPVAVVVKLPGALLEPVIQNRPRGRRPKNIVPMWRERLERGPLMRAARLRAQLDFVRQARADNYDRFKRDNEALRELEKRIAATCAVSADLARRDEELCAELAALGVRAPTYREHLGLVSTTEGASA